MASKGFTGKGGIFSISVDGTVFTPVKQVKTVTFAGSKADLTDITNLDSVGNIRERIPTLIDPGTVSADIVADTTDAGQLLLSSAFFAQIQLSVKVQYPPMPGQPKGLLRTFQAYVSTNGLASLNVADASTFSTELTITGPITDISGDVSA